MNDKAVEFINISKIYPDGKVALKNINLTIFRNEIHGILGENGAGKTTLMRILFGEIKPTSGIIKVFGRKVNFGNPSDALKLGISMVYQNFSLIPSLTVLENLMIISSIKKININELKNIAKNYINKLNFKIDLDEKVENLPVSIQQKVEILKSLILQSKILILDEPTSLLTPLEVKELFKIIKEINKMGITIILITHKLQEILAITDRITVLRKGEVVNTLQTNQTNERELAKLMIGEEFVIKSYSKFEFPNQNTIFEANNLYIKNDKGILAVKGISFDVKEGEIFGIVGVHGNGQKELIEGIIGLRKIESGKIIFNNEDITNLNIKERYQKGISYIPDSRAIGLVLDLDLVSNSILSRYENFSKNLTMEWNKSSNFAWKLIKTFNVITSSIKIPVRYLSGGNQQRVMVGREILFNSKLIVAEEPTHGLDIKATEYIRGLFKKIKSEGRAIILVSSDLDEIFELCDRIAVIFEGRFLKEGKIEEFDLNKLGLLMGGLYV
jgi:simple sugar transport system ATP-binding protein